MKTKGQLDRNCLSGHAGDALLAGAGHNLRLTLNALAFCLPRSYMRRDRQRKWQNQILYQARTATKYQSLRRGSERTREPSLSTNFIRRSHERQGRSLRLSDGANGP
jgi:hypothetical protein